ncbi:hypothetical protein N7512_008986 [Penicillium capsulatum]|nr:hypothetical protein N7512_008986 [Penicillium capsulatum]
MEVAAPSNVPTGADAEANKELASAWRDMEEKMHELASLSHGKNYDENLTADNVRENLQAIQNRKKSEKMDKVKRVFNDSLQVIGVVGGMVAEAASQVFAPAGQCYNALNFVIAAYQGYQRAFESLDSVFAACNDFLNRLTDYVQANMSKNMSMICCDVLRHFVYVCERAIRLRSSALFKVTTYAKIAFLSKDEFSDMLSTMDGLANRELLQSTADTYLNAKEAADNSKIARELLEGDRSEKADEKKERKDKATLVKILAFDQGASTWDSHAEAPIASWGSTYQNIRLNTVADTGNWLFKTNAFRAWAKKKSDTPVLAVVGGEASGKSFLAANAISHLRAHGSGEEMDSRHLVGFFFLNEKKANAGINALGKSIIWQFANSDASYMQSVALTAEEDGQIDPKDILTKLLLHNHKALESIDATFYIVINKLGDEKENVHDGVVDFLKNASLSSNKSVRILFTATQGTVDKLNKRGLSFPALSMSENTDDIRKYVDTHMDRVGVLSRKEDDQVVKLRNEILKTLPQKTKRNYYMIDNFLERISSMDLDKDILKALDEAGGDLSLRIGADVQRLNQIRTAEELGEINTIIIWITFAMERMTVEKMQAVLQFRNEAVSLVPLEERLRKKFLLFEIDNDGCVDFRSEKIPPALRVRASTTKDEEKSGDKVNKGEVDILKHFLGTVCPPDLVNKLQLHQHFDSKLKPQQEQIFREDENTAHFHLAKTCLGVLVDEDAVSLKVLRGYAARHLMDHMSEVNLTLIDSELKKGIGNNLVRLFRFGPAIDNLFWAKRPQPAYPEWIFDQDAMKVITNWLKHTSPDLENDTKAEAWMKGVLDGHIPLQALLEPSVLRMAEYVFQKFESKEVTYAAFQIVELFVSEVSHLNLL